MTDPALQVNVQLLRKLIPLNALLPKHFKKVVASGTLDEFVAGEELFREGESDGKSIYLLDGEIKITSNGKHVETIEAGTFPARHPLAHFQPRKATATATKKSRVVKFDAGLIDILLTWGQSARDDDISEIDEVAGQDWLARMLQLTLFQKLPPKNLKEVIKRMKPMEVRAGESVITQGEEGNYYYVIKRGRCEVTRKPNARAQNVKLAELSTGDSFGEEALVSGGKRNATVTMLTPGIVMRLSKADFVSLIQQPLHIELDYYKSESMVIDGARWLDVRLPQEHRKSHFENDLPLPLPALRLQVQKFKKDQTYICYCDTGRRSSVAAFLMRELGYDAYVLGGGITNLPSGVFLKASIPEEEELEHSLTLISPEELFGETKIKPRATVAASIKAVAIKDEAAQVDDNDVPAQPSQTPGSVVASAGNAAISSAMDEAKRIIAEARKEADGIKRAARTIESEAKSGAEGTLAKAKTEAIKILQQSQKVIQTAQQQMASAKKYLDENPDEIEMTPYLFKTYRRLVFTDLYIDELAAWNKAMAE